MGLLLTGCGSPATPSPEPTPPAEDGPGGDEETSALGDDPRWDRRPQPPSDAAARDVDPGPDPGGAADAAPPTGEPVPDEIAALIELPDGLTVTDTSRSETSTEEVVALTGTFGSAELREVLAAFDAAFEAARLPVSAHSESEEGAALVAVLPGRTLGVSLIDDDRQVFVSVDLLTRRVS